MSDTNSVIEVDVIEDPQRASTLLHPTRLELLKRLGTEDSAAGLSRQMGLPRQRINYHLRELEAQHLLEVVREKRKGNVVEKFYRRTGTSYAVSTAALASLGATPEDVRDRFSSAYQIALASRTVRELGRLQAGAAAAGKKLATMAMEVDIRFATPESRSAFADELTEAVAALARKYHDETAPNGRTFRVHAGAYPKPKEEEKA